MTVKQIVAFRTTVLTLMFVAALTLIYVYRSVWAMLVAIIFILAWFFLHRFLLRKAMRRLQYTMEVLRDVDLLERECAQMKRLLDHTNNTTMYMLDSWLFECRGMFAEAAQAYENVVPRSGQKFRDNYSVNLFYHYCRAGMVDKAAPLLPLAQQTERNDEGKSGRDSDLHNLGLYYLESGDRIQARRYLESALERCQSEMTSLHLHYDLGRLEEAESRPLQAVDHYQKAALIAPKYWFSQVAACRAEVLQHVQHQVEEKAPQALFDGIELPG